MKLQTHFAFALFLGLLIFRITNYDVLGLIATLAYLVPLLDRLIRKACTGQILRSLSGLIIFGLLMHLFLKRFALIAIMAYSLHLITQIIEKQGIKPFWPLSERKVSYVIPKAEYYLWYASLTGIILCFIL